MWLYNDCNCFLCIVLVVSRFENNINRKWTVSVLSITVRQYCLSTFGYWSTMSILLSSSRSIMRQFCLRADIPGVDVIWNMLPLSCNKIALTALKKRVIWVTGMKMVSDKCGCTMNVIWSWSVWPCDFWEHMSSSDVIRFPVMIVYASMRSHLVDAWPEKHAHKFVPAS